MGARGKNGGIIGSSLGSHKEKQLFPGQAKRARAVVRAWQLDEQEQLQILGLANLEAVDIQANTKGITFSRKNKKNAHVPARNMVSVDLKKDFRKVAKTVMNKTEGANYRKDLTKPALARWYKIWKSQNKKSGISKD